MANRFFTAEEIKDYVFEDSIHEESLGSSRWSEHMVTVFEADDGKLYRANWDSGLTELQENEFYDATLEEVHLTSQVVASVQAQYLTEDELKEHEAFKLDKKTLKAAPLISDDAEAGLEAIKSFDATPVLEFLETAGTAILDAKGAAFLAVAQEFFQAVQKTQKKL